LTSGEYFVDAAMPGDGRKKKNAVYDGGRMFWVDGLVKLSDAGEIYVDALFRRIFDEAGGLVEGGAGVYVIGDCRVGMICRVNGLKEGDEGDARLYVGERDTQALMLKGGVDAYACVCRDLKIMDFCASISLIKWLGGDYMVLGGEGSGNLLLRLDRLGVIAASTQDLLREIWGLRSLRGE